MTSRRRWPAEWETHTATWLSWPHRKCLSWSGEGIHRIRPTMLALAETLAEVENVHINITNDEERQFIEANIRSELRGKLRLFDIATDDPWCRDHGPTFLWNGEGLREGICWQFNSWGQKYGPWKDDALASNRMVKALNCDAIESPLVFEPGGLEGNGHGLALVSERSVIHPMRNPGKARDEVERELRENLSLDTLIWVDAMIEGDDTDGHVDNFARFASRNTLLVTKEGLAANPQLGKLDLEIRLLPEPAKKVIVDGKTCPASYANFYIANEKVIVPSFQDAEDDRAARLLEESFPDRMIQSLDSRELLWGHGGIHCITQQVLPPTAQESRDL